MTIKPGKRDDVAAILLDSGKSFNSNSACLLYLVYEDRGNPNVIWVEDVWTDKNEHAAAMGTPEMRSQIMKCMPLLEGMPEQIELAPVGGKGL